MSDEILGSTTVVAFPPGKGVESWQRRNAESPVPGSWPYGLDGLARYGHVTAVELDDPGLARRAMRRLTGPHRIRARSGDPELALAWDENAGIRLLGGIPAQRLACGVVWVTDDISAEGVDPTPTLRMRKALRQFDDLWCTCRPQVDVLREWIGPGPRVHYVPFGVDPDFYPAQEYPDQPLVASVGGDRDRDPATLMDALAIVNAQRPEVECIVQSRANLTPAPGVRTIPSLSHVEVRDLLASASVVAIATRPNSHASGLTVTLESMSTGRPVVVSDTPGMSDYVDPGVTGLLVEPRNPQAMADAIITLVDDRERARAMGLAGRQSIEQRFNTGAMCRALASVLWPPEDRPGS